MHEFMHGIELPAWRFFDRQSPASPRRKTSPGIRRFTFPAVVLGLCSALPGVTQKAAIHAQGASQSGAFTPFVAAKRFNQFFLNELLLRIVESLIKIFLRGPVMKNGFFSSLECLFLWLA